MATEYRLLGFGRQDIARRGHDGTVRHPMVARIVVGKNQKVVSIELTPDDVRRYLKELVNLL